MLESLNGALKTSLLRTVTGRQNRRGMRADVFVLALQKDIIPNILDLRAMQRQLDRPRASRPTAASVSVSRPRNAKYDDDARKIVRRGLVGSPVPCVSCTECTYCRILTRRW